MNSKLHSHTEEKKQKTNKALPLRPDLFMPAITCQQEFIWLANTLTFSSTVAGSAHIQDTFHDLHICNGEQTSG